MEENDENHYIVSEAPNTNAPGPFAVSTIAKTPSTFTKHTKAEILDEQSKDRLSRQPASTVG